MRCLTIAALLFVFPGCDAAKRVDSKEAVRQYLRANLLEPGETFEEVRWDEGKTTCELSHSRYLYKNRNDYSGKVYVSASVLNLTLDNLPRELRYEKYVEREK